jgi:uncharacterized protein (TIGR02217 family)
MAFKNIKLPANISAKAIGGPCFQSNIIETTSGKDFVQSSWSYPKIKYEIQPSQLLQSEMDTLITFFRITQGKVHSFRITDISDYSAKNQILGVVQNQNNKFDFIKTYTLENEISTRKITLVNQESVEIFVNKVKIDNAKFKITANFVEIIDQIKNGDIISANFTFDIRVRFDVNFIKFSKQGVNSYKFEESILLTEVLD